MQKVFIDEDRFPHTLCVWSVGGVRRLRIGLRCPQRLGIVPYLLRPEFAVDHAARSSIPGDVPIPMNIAAMLVSKVHLAPRLPDPASEFCSPRIIICHVAAEHRIRRQLEIPRKHLLSLCKRDLLWVGNRRGDRRRYRPRLCSPHQCPNDHSRHHHREENSQSRIPPDCPSSPAARLCLIHFFQSIHSYAGFPPTQRRSFLPTRPAFHCLRNRFR